MDVHIYKLRFHREGHVNKERIPAFWLVHAISGVNDSLNFVTLDKPIVDKKQEQILLCSHSVWLSEIQIHAHLKDVPILESSKSLLTNYCLAIMSPYDI